MQMCRYGIALGSNLGDRLVNLQRARDAIVESGAVGLIQGKIYETPPVDCPEGSGSFLNTVVEVGSPLEPLELLRDLQQIEIQLGRVRSEKNAPRVIDLDLLYCNSRTVDHPDLKLPHPRMHQRLFVIRPLNDVRPDLRFENSQSTVSLQLNALLKAETDVACFAEVW